MSRSTIQWGRWLAIALAVGLVWVTGAWGAKTPQYTIIDLDGRTGVVRSFVSDVTLVNNTITCVGQRKEGDLNKAVLWEVTPAGSGYSVTTHYLAGGEWAMAVNANGQAVGMREEVDEETGLWLSCGLYWPNSGAAPVLLPPLQREYPLPNDTETECWGINNVGVLVGLSTNKYLVQDDQGNWVPVEEETAVVWRAVDDGAGGVTIIGPFVLGVQPGVSTARRAERVNNCDADGVAQVVGVYNDFGPAMWEVDCVTLESTGPFPLVPPGVTSGSAAGINDNGDSCGGWGKPFRRLADGTFQLLSLPKRSVGTAYDINSQRQVVGFIQTYNNTGGTTGWYGVLWQADGTRKDLDPFLGGSGFSHVMSAKAISDGGIIAASGIKEEDNRAMLMIPN